MEVKTEEVENGGVKRELDEEYKQETRNPISKIY